MNNRTIQQRGTPRGLVGAAAAVALLLLSDWAPATSPAHPEIPERPAPVVVKQAGTPLASRIAAKLGKALTPQQSQEVQRVVRESTGALSTCQDQFVQRLAAVLKVPTSRVQAVFNSSGVGSSMDADRSLIPRFEGQIGRVLATREIEEIRKADAARKEAIRPVKNRLTERLSAITRLPADEIRALLTQEGL